MADEKAANLDLDALFGSALVPTHVDEIERTTLPRSLHKLDPSSAEHLKRLMEVTTEGLGVTRYVYCELPILWVVDSAGELWFALEEVVNAASGEFAWPRLRRASFAASYARLGHPSLIGAQAGRIGGEILFDLDSSPPGWFLTNASGRYGLRSGRHAQNLVNASRKFAEFEIVLREFFIPSA